MRFAIFSTLLLLLVFTTQSLTLRDDNEADDRRISAEIAGRRFLKSTHGTYIGHVKIDDKDTVALVPHKKMCEQWTIVDHHGKVALKPYCISTEGVEYLRASPDGSVTVAQRRRNEEMWTPIKNDDESWSFRSVQGRWLSADKNRSVYTVSEDIDDWEHFWLESTDPPKEANTGDRAHSAEIAGQRTVKSIYDSYLRAWANETDWFVGWAKQNEECERWFIEDHQGKVAFKAYCSGKYLRANVEYYVDLGDKPLAHEMWKPVKNGNGSWSFQGHHGTWLRAQPHGRVSMQTEAAGDEKFWLGDWTAQLGIEGVRSIKSVHGTYLRASYCGLDIEAVNVDLAKHRKACEKWKIEENNGKFSLMPVYESGKYLHANSHGSVSLSTAKEMWTLIKHSDGSWSLKNTHGGFLSADKDRSVYTVTDDIDSWENFWIEEIHD